MPTVSNVVVTMPDTSVGRAAWSTGREILKFTVSLRLHSTHAHTYIGR